MDQSYHSKNEDLQLSKHMPNKKKSILVYVIKICTVKEQMYIFLFFWTQVSNLLVSTFSSIIILFFYINFFRL